MPAHVAHLILAEDAVRGALGSEGEQILRRYGNHVRLGAQGPDLFYHNRRTYPSALRYGNLLHRRGYGTCTAALVEASRNAARSPNGEVSSFILGFAVHACLDRHTHPYIIYRSGWTDPTDPSTRRYYRCHAFLERILDVILLRDRRDMAITEIDMPALLSLGPVLPAPLADTLASALRSTFPRRREDPDIPRRVSNAYLDSMAYYRHCNAADPSCRLQADRRERASPEPLRILALHHPVELPAGIDFANALHEPWRHPCDPSRVSRASFGDLYLRALEEARTVIRTVASALGGSTGLDEVARVVGDRGLDSEEPCADNHPSVCDPFPLAEILDSYRGPTV